MNEFLGSFSNCFRKLVLETIVSWVFIVKSTLENYLSMRHIHLVNTPFNILGSLISILFLSNQNFLKIWYFLVNTICFIIKQFSHVFIVKAQGKTDKTNKMYQHTFVLQVPKYNIIKSIHEYNEIISMNQITWN